MSEQTGETGQLSEVQLAIFLRNEAAVWRECFGAEWSELHLAAEAIERFVALRGAVEGFFIAHRLVMAAELPVGHLAAMSQLREALLASGSVSLSGGTSDA